MKTPLTPPELAEAAERLRFFRPEARLLAAKAASGNINKTWILRLAGAEFERAVLQRLNPKVFPDLAAVMANFRLVTAHLAAARRREPEAPEFPLAYAAPDGRDCQFDESGGLWRLISWIGPSRALQRVGARQAAGMGRTLARFHLLLADLDTGALTDPLPGFHDTPGYLARFAQVSGNRGPHGDAENFCFAMIENLRPLARLLAGGDHARQATHGDPKCANFLFASRGDAALGLIDLDTVREGYILHDLGDALRSCCAIGGEDAIRPVFDADRAAAFLAAYAEAGGRDLLTDDDREYLPEAVRLLIYELGLRFFIDHLEGNRYFACRYPRHNLHRARNQFRLHASLMAAEGKLRKAVRALKK